MGCTGGERPLLLPRLLPFGRLGSRRGLDGLFESGWRDCRTGIAQQKLISNAARIELAQPTLLRDNLSRDAPKTTQPLSREST
jgi:hypothetical protein